VTSKTPQRKPGGGERAQELRRLRLKVEQQARDLSEAREQQVATAEVLKSISGANFDLQAVLDTLVESATRLSGAKLGQIFRWDGTYLRWAAGYALSPEFLKTQKQLAYRPGRNSLVARTALNMRVTLIEDVRADPDYEYKEDARIGGVRTILGVPLLRSGELIGVLALDHERVNGFTERQIELAATFANQAVIAIENARLFEEVQARNRELTEALEQQVATATILRSIAASPTDVEPVLKTVAESAARLCEAFDAIVLLKIGNALYVKAHHGPMPIGSETWPVGRGLVSGRAVVDRAPVHVHDLLEAADEFPESHELVVSEGQRTILAVPMPSKGEPIGALCVRRHEVRPFSQRQIDLLVLFADQAAIAIENTRLFEEVQTRNQELTEALEQQTATGTILKAIAASPTDVEPVLNAVVESATRLCGATFGQIFKWDGTLLRWAAAYGLTPEFLEIQRERVYRPGRDSLVARTALDMQVTIIDDALEDPEYAYKEHAEVGKYRTMLGVPLLRSGELIGVLALVHQRVEPFTSAQIQMVTTFADQAVIAIENTRVFEELQTRNRELTEALEQQTATGTILRAIAASPTNVDPVLNTVAESAAKLCDAYDVAIMLLENESLVLRAHHGPIPLDVDKFQIRRDFVTGRAFIDRMPVHVHDMMQEKSEFASSYAMAERLGFHTILGEPLLLEDNAIGAIAIRRREVRPFSRKQIELLILFADQAAIAIENTRLFQEVQTRNRELTEALEQQTATGTILRAIATSPTDVAPVLNTVVESAARLCGAYDSAILLTDGDALVERAHYGPIPIDFGRWPIGRDWVTGRAYVDRMPIHVHDLLQEEAEFPLGRDTAKRHGYRTMLAVPLMREDKAIGVLILRRREVRPFSQKQIDLLVLFAHQAAIAIENTRLFKELQTRNRELTETLEQQTATGTILRAIAASPADLRPVLKIVAESAARLCDAYDAAILLDEGDALRVRAHHGPIPIDFEKWPKSRDLVTGRAFVDRKPVHVRDLTQEGDEFPVGIEMARRFGHRTMLAVPLLREDKAIGALIIRRLEVRSFSQRQIDLLVLFADQAVIAIENARLFEELQSRNRELMEAIERQTATAEVLKAISRAAFDLPAVLRTLVGSAARLCGASYGGIMLREGDMMRTRALHGGTPKDEADLQSQLTPIDRTRISGRVMMSGHIEHIPDILADREYDSPLPRISNTRALMGIPLLRKGAVEGVFFLGRPEPGNFSQHQSDLVQTFADQAVIAIENVRLLEEVQARTREVQETLDYQTAISEVLNVISRSPSDVQPVLDVILQTAVRLCDADGGTIARERNGEFIRSGQVGFSPEFGELMAREPVERSRGTITGRTLIEGKAVQVLDAQNDPEYTWSEALKLAELHSLLGVPLLRDKTTIGVIALIRRTVRPFTEKQVDLVTTFADQAVIAIENARLFEEVQARTSDLAR
jgi:GAF domain-containing protein